MQTPIYFPNLKKGSTKDCILKLLTAEPTLTNQKIFNQLKKQYNVSRSYQTIRQALLELVEDGVLVKDKKQYSISKDWIMVMDSYVSLLKRKYIENKEINIIDKNTKEIKLDSLYDLGHFILHSFREHFFDMNNENDLYMFVHHLWFPFLNKKKRDLLRDFFSKNNNNIYVGKAYFFDKILAVFYKKYGKVFLNTNFDDFFDFVIQGDCIAKIYIPKELRKRMDKLYSFKNLNFNVIEELTDMTFSDYEIKILITRDKEMVNEIKSKLK